MILTSDHTQAAEMIVALLDELATQHDSDSIVWLAQAIAAYMASSDGEIPIAASAGQHVRMRRAADAALARLHEHDMTEALTEILLLEHDEVSE